MHCKIKRQCKATNEPHTSQEHCRCGPTSDCAEEAHTIQSQQYKDKYFAGARRCGISAEDAVNWLKQIETLVGEHGGAIFGGYCRDHLVYRREFYSQFGRAAAGVLCQAPILSAPFATRCKAIEDVLCGPDGNDVLPLALVCNALFCYMEDDDALAQWHGFKDMDLWFPDRSSVHSFLAALRANNNGDGDNVLEVSHTGKLVLENVPECNALLACSVDDYIDRLDSIPQFEQRSWAGYPTWRRLPIQCTARNGLCIYLDLTWAGRECKEKDRSLVVVTTAVDYHCNRLRYDPSSSLFTLSPCKKVDGDEEDLRESQMFSVQDVFTQIYTKQAVLTRRQHDLVVHNMGLLPCMRSLRMATGLGFSILDPPV